MKNQNSSSFKKLNGNKSKYTPYVVAGVGIGIGAVLLIIIKEMMKEEKVCPWFYLSEFDSPDVKGSGSNMDMNTIKMLCEARKTAGVPFKINSGFRTPSHNAKVGGVANSSHMKGLAADISTPNGINQNKIIKALINAGFKRIGKYPNFVHADNDLSKSQYVAWNASGKSIDFNSLI